MLLRSRFGLMQELQEYISAADARYAVLKVHFGGRLEFSGLD